MRSLGGLVVRMPWLNFYACVSGRVVCVRILVCAVIGCGPRGHRDVAGIRSNHICFTKVHKCFTLPLFEFILYSWTLVFSLAPLLLVFATLHLPLTKMIIIKENKEILLQSFFTLFLIAQNKVAKDTYDSG